MIIDAHTHIGHKTIVASPADLVKSMDASGIDKAMVFAGRMMDEATELMMEEIRPFEGRLYGIGSVSPIVEHKDGVVSDRVARHRHWLLSNAIRGIKFYTGYEHYYPYDERVKVYLKLLEDVGYPAIFHSGDTFSGSGDAKLKYAHPLHIDDIAVDFPRLKIVIAHLGYPFHNDAAEVMYKNANVYADCSGFVYGEFDRAKEQHFLEVVEHFVKVSGTTERILFGTDWPIPDMSSYLSACKMAFDDDPGVMAGHAKALFKL